MTKIITLNLNGIRSAARKGFFEWMQKQNADVVCLQEVRAHMHEQHDDVFYPTGYYHYFNDAKKKGYSGVGVYSLHKPNQIIDKLGWPQADDEGRYLQLDFDNLSVASLYLPSGTSGEERQKIKYDFMNRYMQKLREIIVSGRNFIICGDFNIAHRPIDLKNWRANQDSSGFLPEERAWLDELFVNVGFVDVFRELNKEPEQYTWWSHRGRAWENNVGWRIDYQIVSPALRDKIKSVEIFKEQKFSDHAPLIVGYCLEIS